METEQAELVNLRRFRSGVRPALLWETNWGGALVCLVLALALFVTYYFFLKGGQPTLLSDAYEYAQVARNVVRGSGLTTSAATVLEYSLLGQWGVPVPYFFHDPGNALLLVPFFQLWGPSDQPIGVMSGTFYVLLVPLTFLLGTALFSRPVGWIAAGLTLLAPQLIVYSVTGYSEVPYAFGLTLLFWLLYRFPSGWGRLLAGLAFGALVILRSNSLPFLPGFVIFIALDAAVAPPAGWRLLSQFSAVALFLIGAGLVLTVHFWRNTVYMGHPLYNINSLYALLWYTSALPGKSTAIFSQTGLDVTPLAFVFQNPVELVNKILFQWARTFPALLNGGITPNNNWLDAFTLFLFVLTILAPPHETARQRRFRLLVYALIATALIVGAMFNLRWRHLYGFIPIVLVLNAEFLWRNREPVMQMLRTPANSPTRSRVPVVSLAVVTVVLLALGMSPVIDNIHPDDAMQINRFYKGLSAFLDQRVPPDAVILIQAVPTSLQVQQGLAWYSQRQFVEYSPETFQAFEHNSQPLYVVKTKFPLAYDDVSTDTPQPTLKRVGVWGRGTGNVAAVLFAR